ncbi:hypothetical protein ACFCT7_09675 [Fulvivirgaceae bacterium LMO-SS25]
MRRVQEIFIILFLLTSTIGYSQKSTPLLDRKVSVNFTNVPLKEVLFELSKKGSFNLSYNSNILSSNTLINFRGSQKRISEILPEILPSEIVFKTASNSLVLFRKSVNELKKNDIIIRGTVYDSLSKSQISGATVLDVFGSQSVLTDSVGNFETLLSYNQEDLLVSVSKVNYKDTTLLLKPRSQNLTIQLSKIEILEEVQLVKIEMPKVKAIESYPISKLIIPKPVVINSQNITGYSIRKFQFSIMPGISTNLKIAGTVKNDVSINLIGGYSYGVRLLELGGAFNINRENVNGLQIGGFSNLVGGDVKGLQLSGAMNRTKGKQSGVQITGIGNFNTNKFSGLQLSAVLNLSENVSGAQLSGVMNKSEYMQGLQITTAFNKSTLMKGIQLNTGVNMSDTMNGIQIGIFNSAKQNNGLQIGIVNFSNSSEGLSIGVLNFRKDKKLPRILFAYH